MFELHTDHILSLNSLIVIKTNELSLSIILFGGVVLFVQAVRAWQMVLCVNGRK